MDQGRQKEEYSTEERTWVKRRFNDDSRKVDIRIKDIRKTMTEEGKKDEQRI